MKEINEALTPAGAGTHRVLTSWQRLARHAEAPCARCLPAVHALRVHNKAPGELLDHCCEEGQVLARVWFEACIDLADHLIALQTG